MKGIVRRLFAMTLAAGLLACADELPTAPVPGGGAARGIVAGSGTWTTLAPSAPLMMVAGAWLDGTFYLTGGINFSEPGPGGVFARYDLTTNTWDLDEEPFPIIAHSMHAYEGRLYMFGGFPLFGSGEAWNAAFSFNPTDLEDFEPLPPMPNPRAMHVSVVSGNRVLVFGGTMGFESLEMVGAVSEFNLATHHWRARAPMLSPVAGAAGTVVNGKVYIVGGIGPDGDPVNLLQVYDIGANTWSVSAAPLVLVGGGAATIGGIAYFVSGTEAAAYNPADGTWTSVAQPPSDLTFSAYGLNGGILYRFAGTGDASTQAFRPYSIGNHAPTVDAGGPYAGLEGTAIQFTGSGSSDVDGDALTYLWDFGGGATSTAAEPTHSFNEGTHSVSLTVTDPSGLARTANRNVVVRNVAPVISLVAVDTVIGNEEWSVNASFTDPGNDTWTATAQWSGVGVPQSLTVNPDKTVPLQQSFPSGRNVVRVRVSDGTAESTAYCAVMSLSLRRAIQMLREEVTEKVTVLTSRRALNQHLNAAIDNIDANDLSAAMDSMQAFADALGSPPAGVAPGDATAFAARALRIISASAS